MAVKPPAVLASPELSEDHNLAFDLAGTVALPSPFPAFGRVFVVRPPVPEGSKEEAPSLRFYVKIVHIVSHKQIASALVHPDDVRTVQTFSGSGSPADPANWKFNKVDEVKAKIKSAIQELSKPGHPLSGSFEIKIYDHSVVYVPEAAPVLARLEFAVTAALGAEYVTICPCPPHPPRGLPPVPAALVPPTCPP